MQKGLEAPGECEDCPMEEKLSECCGRHPDTGAVACLRFADGRTADACPHLSAQGACSIYPKRPQACRRHQCSRFGRWLPAGGGLMQFFNMWGGEGP